MEYRNYTLTPLTRKASNKTTIFSTKVVPLFIVFLFCITLHGCSRPTTLEKIKQEKVIHVVTKNAPGVYYEGKEGTEGFEYELAKLFADELGVELRLRVVNSQADTDRILTNGYAHFAAAGMILDPDSKLLTSKPLLATKQLVVYHVDSKKPQSIEDLYDNKVGTISGSHQSRLLSKLHKKYPQLSWTDYEDQEVIDLLKRVEEQSLDYAIIDAVEQDIYQASFPRVQIAFDLNSNENYGWVFSSKEDGTLSHKVNEFIDRLEKDGTLAVIRERYYGHVNQLNYVDARTFKQHIESRLPKYRSVFQTAAQQTNLDWALLAAIGYQESHWRAKAKSPTGVRGLMMLTRVTAKEMGITNRLDPLQSIEGGARYFLKTKSRIPERITEPDRTWMALAAYNVGMGHLEDARILTEKLGKNPDKWIDVKETLPLLQKRKWYKQTRYGYARGYEPVIYVQNIRRYYDVLNWTIEDEARQAEIIAAEQANETKAPIPPEQTAELERAVPLYNFPPTL